VGVCTQAEFECQVWAVVFRKYHSFPPNPFFASSFPRHFSLVIYLAPSPPPSPPPPPNERTIERTNERLPSPHLSALLIF
jgi:hypothetical protein